MIEIKNRFKGDIIHSGDFETIAECLIDAIKNEVNLCGADLFGADLREVNLRGADLRRSALRRADLCGASLRRADLCGADLRGADLRGADLRRADLCGASLRRADLCGADLCGADLRGADLRGADLRRADLWWCAGNKSEIKSMWISDDYPIAYIAEYLQIGCERHPISDWADFDDETIKKMDGEKALNFWRENKDFVLSTVARFPAKKTGKESERD